MKKLFSLFSGLLLLLSCLAPAGSAQSINPGTEIQVQLLGRLDTGKTEAGQEFSASLAQPVRLDNGMAWPTGTEVKGKVVEVVSSGRLSRPASITLQLTQIGNSPVETQTEQIDGQSHAGRNVALIGGIAAVGAVLGGVAGGGKGAVIGAAAGAGAGNRDCRRDWQAGNRAERGNSTHVRGRRQRCKIAGRDFSTSSRVDRGSRAAESTAGFRLL